MIKSFTIALGFLTIIPLRVKGGLRPLDMGRATAFFPAVGGIVGGILVAFNILFSFALPRAVVDLILITILALITGGLHLDGLADTCDGLYGARTREEALAIMKDSRVGAIGGISLIFVIGLKYTSLLSIPQDLKYLALLAMPALSRWSMVLMAYLSGYARKTGGTGKDFVETLSPSSLFMATAFAIIIGIATLGWMSAAAIFLTGGVTLMGVIYFKRRLGGVTGDVLGAVNEVNEVMVLLLMLIFT